MNELNTGEVHGNDSKAWSGLVRVKLSDVLVEPWVYLFSDSLWSQKHSPKSPQARATGGGQNSITASTSFSGLVQLFDYSVVFVFNVADLVAAFPICIYEGNSKCERALLHEHNFPPDLTHAWHSRGHPDILVVANQTLHHFIDSALLKRLWLHSDEHRLRLVLWQEGSHSVEDFLQGAALVQHPVHDIEGVTQSKHFEIQETNAGPELITQGPGLAFNLRTSVQGHAVVCTRDGDLREGAEIRDGRHPWNMVGPRENEVVIVVEEEVFSMAQITDDLE